MLVKVRLGDGQKFVKIYELSLKEFLSAGKKKYILFIAINRLSIMLLIQMCVFFILLTPSSCVKHSVLSNTHPSNPCFCVADIKMNH